MLASHIKQKIIEDISVEMHKQDLKQLDREIKQSQHQYINPTEECQFYLDMNQKLRDKIEAIISKIDEFYNQKDHFLYIDSTV